MSSYRKYLVVKKVMENSLVTSLYLRPADGSAPAPFKPGQHLMFKFRLPGMDIPVFRYYSFSEAYNEDYYRISVKKERPPAGMPHLPAGLCSSYLYDTVREGDTLEAKGSLGEFFLAPEEDTPIVLIAGGIGITPLLSMIRSIAQENPQRPVWLFYGVNEKKEHSFSEELQAVKRHPGFSIHTFYTNARPGDIKGHDYDHEGFMSAEIIIRQTGSIDAHHYICGPDAMMRHVCEGLIKQGVAAQKIHTEAFSANINDAAPDTEATETTTRNTPAAADHPGYTLSFSLSGKTLHWDPRYRSILEFAEANDIDISSGCLFGDCGTCLTRLRGEVKYIHPTMVKPGKDACLPCSCIPAGDVVLDA